MRVIGVDPGTLVLGYGVVEKGPGGKLKHLHHGHVKTVASRPLEARLLAIFNELEKIIEAYQPDAMSVEAVFYAKNARSSITLGHARGVALLCAARAGIKVFEYAPMTIKEAVVGYGNASKEQVQSMVKALLKVECGRFDSSDALAAAICHINHGATGIKAGKPGVRWMDLPEKYKKIPL